MSHDLLAMAFDNSPRRSDPTLNQNIMNRAIEIGMDPYKDSKLFWIAEQSLKSKLPDEWMECTTEEGQVYYFNLRNEDSTWEHPALDHYRQLYQKVKRQQEASESPSQNASRQEQLPDISVTPRSANSKTPGKEAWSVDRQKKSSKKSPRGSTESPRAGAVKPNTSTVSALLDNESPRLVAAHALKQKRDAEKLGGDAAFWRSRYELKETEVDTLARQVQNLEKDLQVNLLQGARLVDENHKLKHVQDDNAGKLRVKSTQVLKHLAKRGFQIDPRRGVGDVDITSATEDMVRVVEAHMEVDEGDRDENGFSLNFDGALARIKKELDYCFTYSKDTYTVDSVELKVKVEDVVQMAIAFGEYLSVNDRETYINRFLDHVISSGKESTMVPLEIITKSIEKHKPAEGRPDVLLDSPLIVSQLRKDLHQEKETTKALGAEVDQKKHEIEVMHTKLMGLQARLEDTRGHEELLSTKFTALSEAIESIKSGQSSGSGGGQSPNKQSAVETKTLQKQVSSLNAQLDISNKRAADAERRLEDFMHKESDMRSDLTKLELNLRLKLDKKKAMIVELQDQKVDLEKVSKELYDELQNALMVSARLEEDTKQLNDIIEEYRAGDASIAVVRERLEIEYEVNKKLKETVANVSSEIAHYENTNIKLSELNEKLELDTIEYREEMAGMKSELARQTNRARVLQDDNKSLVETVRDLKLHIVKLNDLIVEIKGSIRVFARVRPLFVDEIRHLDVSQADLDGLVRYPDYNLLDFNSTPFEFDRVFNPSCDQEDIYDEVEPFIRAVMGGCRVCVFAYGQTGSGKSHTMEGPEDNKGVNYRALKTIMELGKSNDEFKTDVHLSMLEVYNETIRDLLSMESSVDDHLDIRVGKQGVYVDMLSEWPVRCIEEAVSIIDRGSDNRRTASNNVNERSSRSHLVIMVKVDRMNLHNGSTTSGYLYLVDLAGSERVKLTAASGIRLREAQNINKSLSALGDVIAAMASGHKHVPYRNSKLTFLLQDALKESSKVLMFVNINPSPVFTGESTCSLQFATRCRSVQLGRPRKNIAYQANGKPK